jgi:hypothetical protein
MWSDFEIEDFMCFRKQTPVFILQNKNEMIELIWQPNIQW